MRGPASQVRPPAGRPDAGPPSAWTAPAPPRSARRWQGRRRGASVSPDDARCPPRAGRVRGCPRFQWSYPAPISNSGRTDYSTRPARVGQNRTDHPESARQTNRRFVVQGKSAQTRTPMSDPRLQHDGHHDRQPLRVLVADKNAHFRETVRRVLARLGRCVISGEASTIADVVAQVTRSRIDVVLLDVEMVTSDRLAELKRLAKRLPNLKVAVLLSDATPEYRQAVLVP